MSENQHLPLSVQPVIRYPCEAEIGKTYLMTIDLQTSEDAEWHYEEEDYPIYCMVDTSPLFSCKPVGEPAVVLHRFGGSYGEVKFLLTAAHKEMEGEIRLTLVNGWGVPVKVINLDGIRVKYESSQQLTSIGSLQTESIQIIPTFDLQRYQEAIRERYGNLKLDNLDTTGYAYNELKLWKIFIPQNVREANQVLPQVHELPKEHLRRLRESNQLEAELKEEELERYKQVYFEQAIRSVLDIVNDKQTYKYIVILGDPGSGKSILLEYLALNWANSPLDNVISLPIPLLIELRTYMRHREDKECHNFLEFFHKCSGTISHLNQHQLHEQLLAGKALVMFDGLDEVFDPGKREDVITDIHRFTNEYPNMQVIVTSRVIGYKAQRLRDAEFRHFILQDLEAQQIQDFIYRWHELTFNDEADKLRKRERLERGIEASKSIAELAGNPLLLTMMAILNRNQELPRDRAELYNQASRVLLHQWDVERALIEDKRLDPKTIDYKDKQAMLRQVAYYMQTSEEGLAGNLISASHLEKILTDYLKTIEFDKPKEAARVMINQLRTRNFMLCFLGAGYYAFVHRTFLEYFCAWEFVWQFKETQTLTIDELKTEVFSKHWQDETWHEVLQLIAGMIEPKFAAEIIEYLIRLHSEEGEFSILSLAAKCLVEVRNRSIIVSTAGKLVKVLKERAIADNDWYVRRAAVEALVSNFKDDPDTLRLLKDRAIADNHEDVRRAAVEALASNFKDDPDTLPWLKDQAIADNHDKQYVRKNDLIKILFLASDPSNESRLRLVQELRDIKEKLRLANEQGNFVLESRESVRVGDITQALFDFDPQIVHFSGHGTSAGELYFEDLLGKAQPVQAHALANLSELVADKINCVVLDACYSETQAKVIAEHIPFVIGMNQAIGDKAAIAFAVGFYKALGANRSIEEAYNFGRTEIQLQSIPEHLKPILYKKTSKNQVET